MVIIFSSHKNSHISEIVAAYEDSLCIEKWLFLFFGFYSSFVFIYKGMYVVLSDFDMKNTRRSA